MSYQANYKFPFWMWLAGPFTIFASFFSAYAAFSPDMQGDLMDELQSSAAGLVLSILPMPVLMGLFAVFGALMAAFCVLQMFAAIGAKRELIINASGVTHFPLFGAKERTLRWDQMERVTTTQHMVSFSGRNTDGKKVHVNAAYLGGKKKHILAAVAQFAPHIRQLINA